MATAGVEAAAAIEDERAQNYSNYRLSVQVNHEMEKRRDRAGGAVRSIIAKILSEPTYAKPGPMARTLGFTRINLLSARGRAPERPEISVQA